MLFNFVLGESLAKQIKTIRGFSRKSILSLGIISNLVLLGYFKYADFFIENINTATGAQFQALDLVLPLAISFFTFQQIAYLVDSYRRETHEYDFLSYAVFVCFFPQLIAGPIVHHKEMMPQFGNARAKIIHYKNIAAGVFVFSIGLFKKVIIADTFAQWATYGFDTAESLSLFEAWATSLSYTFQLYFDFSGYSDMAIGLALLFNIRLPVNFNSPYKAKNIQDFWRRWHMTLSRFLKDYVYIPLGGNRAGVFNTYRNLLLTFTLAGLWHGAGWLFVFWGFLHGMALIVHRIWNSIGFRLSGWVAWLITFNFINLTWVFFRAKEWEDAIKVLKGMVGLNGVIVPAAWLNSLPSLTQYNVLAGDPFKQIDGDSLILIWLLAALILTMTFQNTIEKLNTFKPDYQSLLTALCCSFAAFLWLDDATEFLYFNF